MITNEEIIRTAVAELDNEERVHEYAVMLQALFGNYFTAENVYKHLVSSALWQSHQEDIRLSDIALINRLCAEKAYPNVGKCCE